MNQPTISVLFVCLGNICRSPLAEAIFRSVVEDAGLADRFEIDSAGTSGYHDGEPPDQRTTAVAAQRGVRVGGKSRRVTQADLETYDHIIVMDQENLGAVERLAARSGSSPDVRLFRAFDPASDGDTDVPDPYFGGPDGFEIVHDLVERSSRGLLAELRERYGL